MLPHHLAALVASSHALWSLSLPHIRFYVPLPGEVMSEVDARVPLLQELLTAQGEGGTDALAAAVQNVVLHSVTFACVSCLQQHVRHAHAVLLQIRGLAAAQPRRWICQPAERRKGHAQQRAGGR